MSNTDKGLKAAAIGILREKYHEADRASLRWQAFAVYANSTPTPEDVPEIVKITEEVHKEHMLAAALFHTNEAKRFEAALIKAEMLT